LKALLEDLDKSREKLVEVMKKIRKWVLERKSLHKYAAAALLDIVGVENRQCPKCGGLVTVEEKKETCGTCDWNQYVGEGK
jgi:ribosomal protein S27AE